MARLVHLSDLHFGAHDERLVEAVERRGRRAEARPGRHQRRLHPARTDRAVQARRASSSNGCASAGHEVLGVPGNHDVPLYDVLRRFLSPLARYRRFIDESLCPFVELPGVAVLGINTARSLTFKDGRINRRAGRVHPRDLRADAERGVADPRHAPSAVRAGGRRARSSARSAGRSWRWTRSRKRASTCCSRAISIMRRARTRATSSRAPAACWWCRPAPRPRPASASRSRASTSSTSAKER